MLIIQVWVVFDLNISLFIATTNWFKIAAIEKFEKSKEKISKKIRLKLENSKKQIKSIKEIYKKKKDMISKYFDYFDTDERMLFERIEEFIEQYNEILKVCSDVVLPDS